MLPRSLLLGLLLTAPLLAGCLDSVPGLEGPGLTARDAANRALPRAQQWQADAVLMEAVGLEATDAWTRPGPFGEGSGDFDFPSDPRVGDGRAPAWVLGYRSPATNGSLELIVFAANGTILADEHRDDEHEEGAGLAAWQVDSPRAVEVAMQDANFSAAARAPDGGLVAALSGPDASEGGNASSDFERDPFWVLMAGSAQAGTGGMVFVNARSGERIPFPFGFPFGPGGFNVTFPPGFPFTGGAACTAQEHASEGFVGATATGSEEFEVDPGCALVEVDLRWHGTAPTDAPSFVLLGPEGQQVQPDEEEREGTTYHALFEGPEPGDYRAEVRAATSGPGGVGAPVGAGVTYELTITVR